MQDHGRERQVGGRHGECDELECDQSNCDLRDLALPDATSEVPATPQVRACLERAQWHFRVNEVLDFGIKFPAARAEKKLLFRQLVTLLWQCHITL